MSSLRSLPFVFPLASCVLALNLVGCPAPEPVAPKVEAPKGPTEADARAALDKALAEKNADALIDVYHDFPKQRAGKEALRRAAKLLIVEVKERADACDESGAKGKLARIAPFTLEDPEINEAYDEMQRQILEGHKRCAVVKLDADVKKAEQAWDWPEVFAQIQNAKEIDGGTLKQRRLAAIARWKTFLDDAIRDVAAGKVTLDDDKAAKLLASVDEAQLPGEIVPDLEKWRPAVAALVLVFHELEDGRLVTPPRKVATFGPAKTRKVESPKAIDGPVVKGGFPFVAIAHGKLDGTDLLLAGDDKPDVVLRLASAKLLFQVNETKGFAITVKK